MKPKFVPGLSIFQLFDWTVRPANLDQAGKLAFRATMEKREPMALQAAMAAMEEAVPELWMRVKKAPPEPMESWLAMVPRAPMEGVEKMGPMD